MTDDLVHLTPDLASLGWDDELDRWADRAVAEHELDPAAVVRGRIARVSRGYSLVFTGGDAVLAASASIRSEIDTDPATGDFVLIVDGGSDFDRDVDGDGDGAEDGTDDAALAAIAPRRTALARRAAGRVPGAQVLAANIDSVFVMHGLDRDLNLRRIERQLVVSWDSGAEPVVVLTKADTVATDDEVDAVVAEVRAVTPGVEVLAVSTVSGRGIDRVAELVGRGRTVALMGLSGIGKSTLVNAVTGGMVQRTGEVRATDHRGRHTTVTRDLIPVPGGGFLIDTPGIREIGLWQAYDGLARTFPEISGEVVHCRFADCDHEAEPGCAVQAAVADGLIPHRRLEHWRDLRGELALQEQQLEEFARRSESRDRAEAERRRDGERPNTRRRSRAGQRRKQRKGRRRH
jgi:ribosome biogenesis GTPase